MKPTDTHPDSAQADASAHSDAETPRSQDPSSPEAQPHPAQPSHLVESPKHHEYAAPVIADNQRAQASHYQGIDPTAGTHQPQSQAATEAAPESEAAQADHRQTSQHSPAGPKSQPDVDSDPQLGQPSTSAEAPADQGTTADWSSEGGATPVGPATDVEGQNPATQNQQE